MVYYLDVFDLRAEEDHFGVVNDTYTMARRPIKEVLTDAGFLRAVGVTDYNLTRHDESPVWCLTCVAIETFQQRRDIGPSAERKIFSGHRPTVRCVTEVDRLAGDGAGHVDLGRDVILGDVH